MNTPSKKHGGARAGAGRKALFKESTRPMRIPLSRIESVRAFLMATTLHERSLSGCASAWSSVGDMGAASIVWAGSDSQLRTALRSQKVR